MNRSACTGTPVVINENGVDNDCKASGTPTFTKPGIAVVVGFDAVKYTCFSSDGVQRSKFDSFANERLTLRGRTTQNATATSFAIESRPNG